MSKPGIRRVNTFVYLNTMEKLGEKANVQHRTVYTVHGTPSSLHGILYSLHCKLCSLHCTIYTVHVTLYSLHCTHYTTVCTVQCTRYYLKDDFKSINKVVVDFSSAVIWIKKELFF